jgi:hypothetical protein
VFFRAYTNLGGLGEDEITVHHGIEKQVMTRYPNIFTWAEIQAPENLRGVPDAINNWAHLSAIRGAWDRFYLGFPCGVATKEDFLRHRDLIDSFWGGNYVPYR